MVGSHTYILIFINEIKTYTSYSQLNKHLTYSVELNLQEHKVTTESPLYVLFDAIASILPPYMRMLLQETTQEC